MLIQDLILTPALVAWFEGAHDDDNPRPLMVHRCNPGDTTGDEHEGVHVLGGDGSPLSATEEREVRALLAAHAAEPLKMPTK